MMNVAALQRQVNFVSEGEALSHEEVATKVQLNRERQRGAARRLRLPNFAVDDCVLMAWVRRLGSISKLMST